MLAQDAGAIAVIGAVPDWDANEVLRPTLLDPAGIDIPAVVAGQEPAQALLAAAESGASVDLTVDVTTAPANDDNVLGQLPGSGNDPPVLMLGGHLDSVLDGPGLNDNGSGVATLLALAEMVASRPDREWTVRFAFWGAEEFGVLGSNAYVESLSVAERDRILAYVNLDMVGSPNAGYYVYDDVGDDFDSSQNTTDWLMGALNGAGVSPVGIPSGGSDHVAFQRAGISTGGVFSGIAPLTTDEAQRFDGVAGEPADPCYHLACDTRANVNTATAATFGEAVWSLIHWRAY